MVYRPKEPTPEKSEEVVNSNHDADNVYDEEDEEASATGA